MAKSKKGTIHVDTWGMTNHVKPKLDDAHNRMEHIYREWQRMSTPPDFGEGEELKSFIFNGFSRLFAMFMCLQQRNNNI